MSDGLWAYLDEFLVWTRARQEPPPVRQAAVVAYRSKLRQFREWLGEREPTAPVLNEYREYLQFDRVGRHGGAGQKPRTIKAAFTPLSQFFDWLRVAKGIDLPAPSRVRKPRVNKRDHGDHRVPSEEDVGRLFQRGEEMPGYTLRERLARAQHLVMLSLAVDCALRCAEVLTVDWPDLRMEAEVWVVTVRKAKGEEYREVPVNARCRAQIEAYLKVWREWCDLQPTRRRNVALLPIDSRRRWGRETISLARHRLLDLAGLPHNTRLHDFRRFRCSRWLGVSGVNVATVADLMGHADLATTLGYADASEQEKLRAVTESSGGAAAGARRRDAGARPRRQRQEPRRARALRAG